MATGDDRDRNSSNAFTQRGERVMSRSLHSDMARQKGEEKRRKKRSQSVFPPIYIIEDFRTLRSWASM